MHKERKKLQENSKNRRFQESVEVDVFLCIEDPRTSTLVMANQIDILQQTAQAILRKYQYI